MPPTVAPIDYQDFFFADGFAHVEPAATGNSLSLSPGGNNDELCVFRQHFLFQRSLFNSSL